jgi:hypothetical protein
MPGHVLIAGYVVGYRTKGIGGYTEPYTDLPMLRVGPSTDGFVCADAAYIEACKLCKKLREDFPNAEWRMIECWE